MIHVLGTKCCMEGLALSRGRGNKATSEAEPASSAHYIAQHVSSDPAA